MTVEGLFRKHVFSKAGSKMRADKRTSMRALMRIYGTIGPHVNIVPVRGSERSRCRSLPGVSGCGVFRRKSATVRGVSVSVQ